MSIVKTEKYSVLVNIVIWGAIWGIFEATVGHLLHLVSFGYARLIWYPVACFFMTNVYRKTGRLSSVFFVGLLCAAVKMLNLFLPGRIDKVINPAVSIIFEAASLAAVVFLANHLLRGRNKNPLIKVLMALGMNTGWRLLYILYLFFLVPDWMQTVSVIGSISEFVPFFITNNLITTAVILLGYQYKTYIYKPLEMIEHRLSARFDALPTRIAPILRPGMAVLLLCSSIALQFLLR